MGYVSMDNPNLHGQKLIKREPVSKDSTVQEIVEKLESVQDLEELDKVYRQLSIPQKRSLTLVEGFIVSAYGSYSLITFGSVFFLKRASIFLFIIWIVFGLFLHSIYRTKNRINKELE